MVAAKDGNNLDRAIETENRQRHRQLATFNEIGKALTSSLHLSEVLGIVMEKISELLGPRNWSLLLLDEKTGELRFEIAVGKGAEKLKDLRLKLGEGIAGWVAKEKRPLLVPDVSKDPRFSSKADEKMRFTTKSLVCVPLVAKGRCLGVIELVNKVEEGEFGDEDLLILGTLADYTAIAVENAIYFKRVQELTITDDLTGLYNSRFLHGRVEYEVERARRFGNDLSLIFVDLDYFKDVNDTYGHLAGSKLLTEVAGLFRAKIRSIDMPCRYGGDEFIILMPHTSKSNAVLVAQKLHQALGETSFLKDEGLDLHITGSFGVAAYPLDARDKNELITLADKAMYKVKALQRDGVAEA